MVVNTVMEESRSRFRRSVRILGHVETPPLDACPLADRLVLRTE